VTSHHRPIQIETLQAVIERQGVRLRELTRRTAKVADALDTEANSMDAHGLPGPNVQQLLTWARLLRGVRDQNHKENVDD